MPDHTITVTEEQRQLLLLALAILSLKRPGWDYALRELCRCIPGGVEMFDAFRAANRDKESQESDRPGE